MSTPLRVLFIEDSEDDMLLQVRELKRGGYDVFSHCVQTAEELRLALACPGWQLIISDYALPSFTGIDALRMVKASGLDIPFILISGTVGEETAVESMRAGAADYLLKANLTRLVPAVRRELREAEQRRQRREAELALRDSQALLSLIYEHLDETLLLFVRDNGIFRVASANQAWVKFSQRLNQRTYELPLGKTLEQVLEIMAATAEEKESLLRGFVKALAQSSKVTFEQEWIRAGRIIYTEQHFIPVPQVHDACRHVLWVSHDVSERKHTEDQKRRLEAQLMQAQKLEALGTLSSSIAHDFNNILAGLSGYAEMVRSDTQGLPQVQDTVHQMMQGIHRATDLVRRILAFSRKRTVLRRPIHLGPVIHEALQFLRPLVPAGVRVEANLPTEGAQVVADAGQMHQVVINLCTNAIQAMSGSGGTLWVSLEPVVVEREFAQQHSEIQPGAHVRLSIRDNGCGMDPETLDRLFEPFFTTKPIGVGTGLGLAVVQGIVQSHQGLIRVHSAPGRGTTFELYFPVAAAANEENVLLLQGKGERILFVDDEEYLVQMGSALLTRLGYQVSAFSDPEKALYAFTEMPDQFAAMITDLTMPVLKGTDLAFRVRQIRPSFPVILTTGFSGPHELDRARRLGFDRVLDKPYTIEKIAEALREVLSAHRR